MNANLTSPNWNAILSSVMGVAAVVVLAAYLLGWKVPLIGSDRTALLILAGVGFGMCMLAMDRTVTGLGWTHPITLIGSGLGVLLILLVIAMLAGWRLPFIPNDRAALLAVAFLGLVKWGLGIFSHTALGA